MILTAHAHHLKAKVQIYIAFSLYCLAIHIHSFLGFGGCNDVINAHETNYLHPCGHHVSIITQETGIAAFSTNYYPNLKALSHHQQFPGLFREHCVKLTFDTELKIASTKDIEKDEQNRRFC